MIFYTNLSFPMVFSLSWGLLCNFMKSFKNKAVSEMVRTTKIVASTNTSHLQLFRKSKLSGFPCVPEKLKRWKGGINPDNSFIFSPGQKFKGELFQGKIHLELLLYLREREVKQRRKKKEKGIICGGVFALPHTDPNDLNQGSLGLGLVTVNDLSGSGPHGRK